ncbi:TPA: hypothetical protein ACPSKB_000326 [Legionella feeleii]|uniref:Uncharacterized protein n=1 Tax=Legionella feeleii TaxID=453 RepID=A0A378IUY2_9GAMM|nr:hypothetical protein [Legionella feeleii]STX38385.1 Uncharacterised protein [Legionella feeleii]
MPTLIRLIILLYVMFFLLTAQAEIDPSKLIKVTNDNNPNCVEYYNYKGEIYCSITAQDVAPMNPQIKNYETQKITFDNRPWKVVFGKKTEEITVVEYVPADDNIEHWQELVTSQFIPGLQTRITMKQYIDSIINNLKESGFKPIVTIIEETPDQALFEFRIDSPSNMQQDELQFVTKGNDGFYILHYVIRKADMGKPNRNKWIGLLKKTKPK